MRIRVLHSYYGCDTGCCGHIVNVEEGDTEDFNSKLEWVKSFLLSQLGEQHIKDLDWDGCEILYG